MKARVLVSVDGRMSVITQEGTFEEGVEATKRLLASLGEDGLVAPDPGDDQFERHRHGDAPVRVRTQAEVKA